MLFSNAKNMKLSNYIPGNWFNKTFFDEWKMSFVQILKYTEQRNNYVL